MYGVMGVISVKVSFFLLAGFAVCLPLNGFECGSGEIFEQPTVYDSLIAQYGVTVEMPNGIVKSFDSKAHPIIRKIIDSSLCSYHSEVNISEAAGLPSSSGWSHCSWCGWDAGRVYLRSKGQDANVLDLITLSWSQWGEFFHNFYNDQYKAEVEDSNSNFSPSFIVHRPIFIIPMITFHAGHILVDLIEQLFHCMMLHYGEIRKDSILIVDVAAALERPVLQEKLSKNIDDLGDDRESIAHFLKAFTNFPVFSFQLLNELGSIGGVVFQDIHFGIDNTHAYFQRGYAYHPQIMTPTIDQPTLQELARRYQSFRSFAVAHYLKRLQEDDSKTFASMQNPDAEYQPFGESKEKILIVQRSKNRVILNLREIVDHLLAAYQNADVVVADFDVVSFPRQMKLLEECDILISMAGTSLHNLLFMRTTATAVVIIMQPRWCPWAWMYANQAILLGIKPFIHCPQSSVHLYPEELDSGADAPLNHDDNYDRFLYFQWSRKFWMQGPRYTKSENATLSSEEFVSIVGEAIDHFAELEAHPNQTDVYSPNILVATSPKRLSYAQRDSMGANDNAKEHDGDSSPHEVCNSLQMRRARIAEMYLAEVSITGDGHSSQTDPNMRIALMGEIAMAQRGLQQKAESLSRLSVCFRTLPAVDHYLPPADTNGSKTNEEFRFFVLTEVEISDYEASSIPFDHSWHATRPAHCYPFSVLNYYSNLFFNIGSNVILSLHVWAQSSPSGGKLKGSDVFVSLDCRLPACGFTLPNEVHALAKRNHIQDEYIAFDVVMHHDCWQNLTTIDQDGNIGHTVRRAQQVISFPNQQIGSSPSAHAEFPVQCSSNETHTFRWKIASGRSLQRYSTDFCHCHSLTSSNCGIFVSAFLRYLESWYRLRLSHTDHAQGDDVPLPLIQSLPSPRNPFFFVHIEKTAGTSLREFIYEAAEKRHLSAYIPCHADLPCQTFALPDHREKGSQGHARKYPDRPRATDLTNLSVVAGHFGWATWRNLPQCSPANASNVAGARRSYYGFSDLSCRPSCFAMARHPVQRAISFYYQRIFRAEDSIGFFRQLKHLSVEELTAMIENELSVLPSMHMPDTWIYIDEGMSNGACRTMLTYENKMAGKIVSKSIHARTKLPGDYFGRGRRLLFPEERIPDVGNLTEKFDEELVKNAVFNMKHCVIGLQEHWADSLKMVNHWFPWIDTSRDPYRRKLQLVQGQESHELLRAERPDLYDVLVEYNNCDMVLYDAMVKRYEEQVKYLQYLKF